MRSALTKLSGITGIICNLLLCAVKFILGSLTSSVSVTADAANNLSDCASNIVTLAGTRLSDKPDDEEHPFGHGRAEYISALVVAISIFVVCFELAKSSVIKIVRPEELKFSEVYVIVLLLTVLVKLGMAYFNSRLYALTGNINLKAVKQDSLNDCVATASTIVSLVISHTLGFKQIDGIIGLCVSAFIFISGVSILKQVISPLLGEPPSKELTDRIEQIITESDIVLGVHDLVIHSYGENKKLASADAEVDAATDIITVHNEIDKAEKKIQSELGVIICIHTDPVDRADTQSEKYRLLVQGIIKEYDEALTFHDFVLNDNDGKKEIHFDLVIPFDKADKTQEINEALKGEFGRLCPEASCSFTLEHPFTAKE